MAEHRPLVLTGGVIRQLPTGDTVAGAGGGGGGPVSEIEITESVSDPSPVTGALVLFAKTAVATESSVPYMTDTSAPSGTASASESYVNNAPWKGFAAPGNGWGWASNGSALPHWLKYQFPAAKAIYRYSIDPWDYDAFPQRCFKDFTLQGSNDDSNWTTLDTRTNITGWALGTAKYFDVASPGSYIYYRLHVTANGGDAYVGTRHVRLISNKLGLWVVLPDGSSTSIS